MCVEVASNEMQEVRLGVSYCEDGVEVRVNPGLCDLVIYIDQVQHFTMNGDIQD